MCISKRSIVGAKTFGVVWTTGIDIAKTIHCKAKKKRETWKYKLLCSGNETVLEINLMLMSNISWMKISISMIIHFFFVK